jgi:hypothetical protein
MAELRVQLLNGQHHRDAARVTLFCHVLQAGKISPAGRKAETIRALQ